MMLGSKLGTKMVTVFVGKKRKEFGVHRRLLCDTSDFFARAFNSQFKEGVEGIMYLPEDSPGSFSLLVDWLYRGSLPDRNSEQHLQDLYNLYLFAEKIIHTTLKDDTIDKIQDTCRRHDKFVDIELVRKVYKRTPAGCPLRNFCLYLTIHQYSEDLKVRMQFLNEAADPGNAEEKIRNEYVENVRGLIGGDFRFFDEFFAHFESEFTVNDRGDPRIRDEDDEHERCLFHCHARGRSCREWDVVEEDQGSGWVDGVEDDEGEDSETEGLERPERAVEAVKVVEVVEIPDDDEELPKAVAGVRPAEIWTF